MKSGVNLLKIFNSSKYFMIWSLFPKNIRLQFGYILILTLLGTLLEMLSVGLVVPAISLMLNQNIFEKYPATKPLSALLGSPSQQELVGYGVTLLLITYLMKALYLAYMAWKQAKFIFGAKEYISICLFNKYLNESYEFHLQHNSSQLIRNITTEVTQLVSFILSPTIVLITELCVVISLLVLLFVIEPAGSSILLFIAIVSMYSFHFFTKSQLQRWGAERQQYEAKRIQKVQEGLSGIKIIKLLGRENIFSSEFRKYNLLTALVEQKQHALSQTPRLWMETVGVFSLSVLILVALYFTSDISELIPIIALFAAASFRLIPSSNRILISLQSLRYGDAVIKLLYKELLPVSKIEKNINNKIVLNENISFENLSYTYPNASKPSLININLSIKKGECVGFIGPSGAGKTTLVDVMLGLLEPSAGRIAIDGVDAYSGLRNWRNLIGYVQQDIFLLDGSLRENIAFGLHDSQIDDAALRGAIFGAQLDRFIDDLPAGVETIVGERGVRMSGGQRQRIGIARALYQNPPVLVFDEATSALDSESEQGVMEAIRALKGTRTIIIIAHRLSTIESCDSLYKLEGGRLVQLNGEIKQVSHSLI